MDLDDDSSDVVAIKSDDEFDEITNSDKPIIQLFKRLIMNNSKQSTVLTNTQIVEILHKEFNVNILELHELEGDIYLTIIKKFLKDWPQWDEFDQVVNSLKIENKKEEMEKIFQAKYNHLKNYLQVMLNSAQDLAKETVKKALASKTELVQEPNKDSSDQTVILEVHASRNQLNQLFFRQPNSKLNNSVFNGTYSLPTQIQLKMLPLEAILNWWGVNISLINATNQCLYKREMKHELKHVLINKSITNKSNPIIILDQNITVFNYQRNAASIEASAFTNFVDKIASESNNCFDIYDFIKKDIKMLPHTVYSRVTYKRYINKYPYIRYLYQDVKNVEKEFKKFDLQLEETVSPMYQTYIGQMHDSTPTLMVQCEPCSVKFSGPNLVYDMKNHFNIQHQNEPDWKCTNCNKKFSMSVLALNWWSHRC